MKQEWQEWWESLSPWRRALPTLVVLSYWTALSAVGGLNFELVAVSLAAPVLYYLGPRARPVFGFFLPFILTVTIYDSQRYYADLIRGPIHVREPYQFDIVLVPVYLAVAAYFRFILSRRGNRYSHARSTLYRSPQVMWAFFWVNIIGWSTYYWYAASPPSADVHGAIPSLYVAYPLISFYYALRFGALRIFTFLFFLLVSFATVYLNHHYVLDVVWGMAYAIIVAFSTDMIWNYQLKKKGIMVPGYDPIASPSLS